MKLNNLIPGIKKYGHPYLTSLILAIGLAILGNLATLIGPNQLSKITNMITAGLRGSMDTNGILKIVLFLAIIYGIGAIMSYGQGFIMANVSQNFTRDLRTKISLKINNLPISYFDTHNEGDTLSRVTNDLDTFGQALNQSLGTLVSSFVLIVGAIIMMTWSNWILSLTAVLSAGVGMVVIDLLLSHSQKYFIAQQKQLAEISSFVEESYSGHEVIKTYNNTKDIKNTFSKTNNNLQKSVLKAQFLSGIMQPFMNFIGNFGYVAVSIVGALLVLNGSITIGTVVAFMVYVRIFTQPLGQITQAFSGMQSAEAALERVFEFLDEPEQSKNKAINKIDRAEGKIDFEQVSFGYNSENKIISNFSATINPGQKVAIVGPTGAGKTTILSLLMGYYKQQSGTIKIDDIDTATLATENVRDQFDMVLQDTWLFEGTIMENLKYNDSSITDEQVIEAAKAVGVDHLIRTLADGYNTILNSAVSISVGQKQLLTIARALVRNRPILILDEATSSVDTRTEEQLQKAMDLLTKGRTSLVIAHRLSTIKNSDNILVLNHGKIIESGNHQALMNQNGFYANLYNSQFDKLTA